MKRMKTLNGYSVFDENTTHFISTIDELREALSNGVSPIVMEKDVEIEVDRQLTVRNGVTFDGNNAKFMRATGFEGTMFVCQSDIVMRNMRIDGNRTAMTAPTWNKTKEIAAGDRNVIENIIIENGNEAIVTYGDDSLIRHCYITNCGGNGIHFSDAPRTRVENCTIIGANKQEGMGHEGGCISWSMDCQHIICENNYLEDGLSGLGYIKVESASNIKITGNTVKDCGKGVWSIFQTSLPKNVLISNNQFINSGTLQFNRTDENVLNEGTWLISNNLFDNTVLEVVDIFPCVIEGNIFKNLSAHNQIGNTKYVTVRGNHFSGFNASTLFYLPDNSFLTFEGNTVVFSGDVDSSNPIVNVQGTSLGCVIKGNVIEVTTEKHTGYTVNVTPGNGTVIEGNRLSLKSGKGINLGSNVNCSNNIIICATAEQQAIYANGSVKNTIIANNLSNGVFKINSTYITPANNIVCDAVEFAVV